MTHAVFTLAVAPHEREPDRAAWRVRHAAETFAIVRAWFDEASESGNYRLHATSRDTLDMLRQMIIEHEGMTIVSETIEDGDGISEDDRLACG
jgi:hypothetical protein